MMQNIIAGIMTAIAIAAGVFGWWMDNINTVENDLRHNISPQNEDDNRSPNEGSSFSNRGPGETENSVVNMTNSIREEQ
ncbi:MAG: hypothetical protein ACI4DU_10875 [Lachnospiraceae bacterium]